MLTSDALIMRSSDSAVMEWDDGVKLVVPFVPGVTLALQCEPCGIRKNCDGACCGLTHKRKKRTKNVEPR